MDILDEVVGVGIPESGIDVPELRRKAFLIFVESEIEGRDE